MKYKKLVPCNCDKCKAVLEPHFYPFNVLIQFWEDHQESIQCQKSYKMVNVQGLLDDTRPLKPSNELLDAHVVLKEGERGGGINIYYAQSGPLQHAETGNNTLVSNEQTAETAIIENTNIGSGE